MYMYMVFILLHILYLYAHVILSLCLYTHTHTRTYTHTTHTLTHRSDRHSVSSTVLFDEGATVHWGIRDTGIQHGLKITTRYRWVIPGLSKGAVENSPYYPGPVFTLVGTCTQLCYKLYNYCNKYM